MFLTDFEAFLEKISPLRSAKKIGAILIQLPPKLFTVSEFRNVESFLNELSTSNSQRYDSDSYNNYQYALEFRHPSWRTEGPWELLRHYNIAAQ